jgi:hypothetical protein
LKGIFTKSNVPIGDYDIIYGNKQMYAYCDGDWAGNMDDYKSTLSYFFHCGA